MGALPAARRARPHDAGAGTGAGNEPPGALFPDAGTDGGGFLSAVGRAPGRRADVGVVDHHLWQCAVDNTRHDGTGSRFFLCSVNVVMAVKIRTLQRDEQLALSQGSRVRAKAVEGEVVTVHVGPEHAGLLGMDPEGRDPDDLQPRRVRRPDRGVAVLAAAALQVRGPQGGAGRHEAVPLGLRRRARLHGIHRRAASRPRRQDRRRAP